jgi:glutamine synthetase
MKILPNNFLDKLAQQLKKNNQLEKIGARLLKEHNLAPNFGVELEFYLSNVDITKLERIIGLELKTEKGKGQFEVNLKASEDLEFYAKYISQTKTLIERIAADLGGRADFSPKPFVDDYGNSMHMHISFAELTKEQLDHFGEILCHFMLKTCLIFMPTIEDYLRLDQRYMAPTHVSFGNNNRTVAVRLPDSLPKRLEHRIASPLADPYLVMYTILNSILIGLESPAQIKPRAKIFGNAYENQYQLTPLPRSIDEAKVKFDPEFFAR